MCVCHALVLVTQERSGTEQPEDSAGAVCLRPAIMGLGNLVDFDPAQGVGGAV